MDSPLMRAIRRRLAARPPGESPTYATASDAPLAPRGLDLHAAAGAADAAAARGLLARYQARLTPDTRRRQIADLACFAAFLALATGAPPGDLADDPAAWAGVSWGLVEAFVAWQLQQGYAIGSINVRLSSVKVYARLACQAGALSVDALAAIRLVNGFRRAAGARVDAQRSATRVGAKKSTPTRLTPAQAGALKAAARGRDLFLLCLLLDHGLRAGELALLESRQFDRDRGLLRFYRPKVNLTQTHRLSLDAAAAAAWLDDAPATGPVFPSTRQIARIVAAAGVAVGVTGLSPHDCRHYWATAATRAGTPLKALQDAGGWASPAMPLRYAESTAIANDGVRLD